MRPQLEFGSFAPPQRLSSVALIKPAGICTRKHPRHDHQALACEHEIFKLCAPYQLVTGGEASIGQQEKPRRGGASSSKFGVILKTPGNRGGPGSRLASPCMLDAIQMRGVQSKTRIVLFYRYWVSRSLAEGVGFEPTRERKPPGGFQDRCLKPLGHPSFVNHFN